MGTAGYAKGWKCTDFFETFGNGGGSYERGREGFVGFLRVGRFVHIPGKMLWLGEQGGAGVEGSVVRGVETVFAGGIYTRLASVRCPTSSTVDWGSRLGYPPLTFMSNPFRPS